MILKAHKDFDSWISREHPQYVKLAQPILTAKQITAPFLQVLHTAFVSAVYLTYLMIVAQSWRKLSPLKMGFLSPLHRITQPISKGDCPLQVKLT